MKISLRSFVGIKNRSAFSGLLRHRRGPGGGGGVAPSLLFLSSLLDTPIEMSVFLTIDIGDAEAYSKEREAYDRACKFLKESGAGYGLSGETPADLDDAGREMLMEVYGSDPAASSAGPAQITEPASLTVGRLEIDLNEKESPKACENFKALCTGSKGMGKESKKPLHYKGTRFHRIQSGFVAQGGDFTRGDGSGGESIWGKKFNDDKDGLKVSLSPSHLPLQIFSSCLSSAVWPYLVCSLQSVVCSL